MAGLAGGLGSPPREQLEQGPFDYVAGGAGSEATVRANREAFDRRRLRPRMLTGNAERDLSVEVLGLRSPVPFLLAPVGVLSIVHAEAELGVARASRATGVPMILSSAASTSLEDSDPLFRERLGAPPEDDLQTASLMALAAFPNLALTWADLEWLRARTDLPVLVKGVLTAEDARLALDHGVDGIVVSNHGGRQVDGAVASLDALVEVRDEVGSEATVLMDSGIRRGADVLKAIALGADAVLLGRLYAYGLAVGGAAGVEAVIRQLAAEVDLTLALAGGRAARDFDRSMVT